MTVYLATANLNKIKEIKNFLENPHKFFSTDFAGFSAPGKAGPGGPYKSSGGAGPFKKPVLVKSLKSYVSPEETGSSFKENARIKAFHLLELLPRARFSKSLFGVLAEDSGLEAKALKGEPGIHSARYSGPLSADQKNNKKLLKKMKNQSERRARYVCALSFLLVEGGKAKSFAFEAYCEGRIAHKERGKGGFGYDPLFIPKGSEKTFAEGPLSYKQSLSHRRKALEKWLRLLKRKKLI